MLLKRRLQRGHKSCKDNDSTGGSQVIKIIRLTHRLASALLTRIAWGAIYRQKSESLSGLPGERGSAEKNGAGYDPCVERRGTPSETFNIGTPAEPPLGPPWGWCVGVCVLTLIALGMMNLYSATLAMSGGFFNSQLKHWLVIMVVMAVVAAVPLRWVIEHAYIILGLQYLLLVAVLVWGHSAGGSQRWLDLGFLRIQPSELAKLTVAVFGARYLGYRSPRLYTLRSLLPLGLMVGGIFALIFLQPDLGTAGLAVLVLMTQLAFITLTKVSVIIAALMGVVSLVAGWLFVLHDYQKQRILALIYPDIDPMGRSYSQLQSLVAIGSGGTAGKGYLEGTQSHLRFLPSRHTDFIFSVFAEEHGLWGCVVVFLLFGALTYFALEIARETKNRAYSFLATGLAAFLFFEFAVNVAMVLGMFPVVGIPLPFFSHGGSSMMSVMIACVWLLMIHRLNHRSRFSRGPHPGVKRCSPGCSPG